MEEAELASGPKSENTAKKKPTRGDIRQGMAVVGATMPTNTKESPKKSLVAVADGKKAKTKKLERAESEKEEIERSEKKLSEITPEEEKGVKKSTIIRSNGKATKKTTDDKAIQKERLHGRNSDAGMREKIIGTQSPNLEKHVEAIRERRMSLPRTVLVDNGAEVELVIGDDGKPVFHPTVTPKTEEIIKELTEILLEDKDSSSEMKSNLF
nr:unnamed protein product [Haemonchus contortus]